MRTYTFTNGKKETKTYKEISNVSQGCYEKDEMVQRFQTDNITKHQNEQYNTRFEEVKS